MLKSRKLAYDGRGNAVAKSEKELDSALNGKMFIKFCMFVSFLVLCDLGLKLIFIANFL